MTPHNKAEEGSIAKTVLMPGDPLRAKYIAETYLTDVRLVNDVRNIYAYTGKYKDKEISIMASGMGIPSMGIYSYELYKFYGVENIIRIGSTGAYKEELDLYSLVLASHSFSESSFAKVQGYNSNIIKASDMLNNKIIETAQSLNLKLNIGTVHSSDVFYSDGVSKEVGENNCLCVEMESFALFYNALKLNKNAACILTVSDNLVTKKETTPEERQNAFNEMMILALETARKL